MKEFVDNNTPISRDTLMAMQGFVKSTTTFADGSVTETNDYGEKLITTFKEDGTIEERFEGTKTMTKIIQFNSDGSIAEVVS